LKEGQVWIKRYFRRVSKSKENVEYILTERAKSLENILNELCLWGKKYMI